MTEESLKELLESRLAYLDRAMEARWAAHDREHAALREAIATARAAVDHRLEGMNELREQITRERATYVSREHFDQVSANLSGRIDDLKTRMDKLESRLAATWATVAVLVPAIYIVVMVGLDMLR